MATNIVNDDQDARQSKQKQCGRGEGICAAMKVGTVMMLHESRGICGNAWQAKQPLPARCVGLVG